MQSLSQLIDDFAMCIHENERSILMPKMMPAYKSDPWTPRQHRLNHHNTNILNYKLWSSKCFQDCVRRLFLGMYPHGSEEDTVVRYILCALPCQNRFLFRAYENEADRFKLPLICTVFYKMCEEDAVDLDETDRRLLCARDRLRDAFCAVLLLLESRGDDAQFDDVTPELEAELIQAARLYARHAKAYETEKAGAMDEERREVLQTIPVIHALAWPSDQVSMRKYFLLKCDFYVRFGRPLTPHVAMLIVGNLGNPTPIVPDDILNLGDDAFYRQNKPEE